MSDRIVLTNLRFDAIHGVHPWEREASQPFEIDVELWLDLAPAGRSDELAQTVDYGRAYDVVAAVLQGPPRNLLESLAEAIATETLEAFAPVASVVVRVRKPGVRLGGPLDHASVEVRRSR